MQATLTESYEDKGALRIAGLLKRLKGARHIFIGEIKRLVTVIALRQQGKQDRLAIAGNP